MRRKYSTVSAVHDLERFPKSRYTSLAHDGRLYLYLDRFHCIKCEKYTPKGKEYCGIPMGALWEKED